MATTVKETFFRCDSWQDAAEKSQGYDASDIVYSLVESKRKDCPWKNKTKDYISPREIELTAAMSVVNQHAACKSKMKVADVGGGMAICRSQSVD